MMAQQHKTFLLEIGTEELPPKQIDSMNLALANNLEKGLRDLSLSFGRIKLFSSPRRLAVLIEDLQNKQPEQEITKKGPPVSIAFDENDKPTIAATKFADSCGVDISKLIRIEEKKKLFLAYKTLDLGKETISLLPPLIIESIKKIPIKKAMFWGQHIGPFVRPIHWVLALFGGEVIDLKLFAVNSSNQTFGHRFHYPIAITVSDPNQYEELLFSTGRVIADAKKRQNKIREQINSVVKNGAAVISEDLLSEVTNIVEWPVALVGSFDKQFLKLPKEVLITTLKKHQRCFPVVDQEKNLLPNFVIISNIESKSNEQVTAGNERVIKARFSDAEYFYETDIKQNLADNLEKLKQITFQEKLGSLYDKTLRLQKLVSFIAKKINADPKDAERAAELSKCDLVSSMVWEFPELQGVMGKYYSQASEDKDISSAIEEQYLPRFSKDDVPKTLLGSALAIADRADTLVGLFGINKIPTGDKDPFGLRRAASGIISIILEKNLQIDLKDIFSTSFDSYGSPLKNKEELISKLLDFSYDRLQSFYTEQNKNINIFRSVLASLPTNILDFSLRFDAVDKFTKLSESEDLIEIYKRVKNILNKNEPKTKIKFSLSLTKQNEEKHLAKLLEEKTKIIENLYQNRKYLALLKELITFKKPLDDFFNEVMVMDKDEKVRNNRLALLKSLQLLFVLVSDLSFLVSGGK